uniref:NADH-ubiquinone oxidoreductase chain 4L n=1 Tax=Marphysa sanguinea TaxID=167828 RepID=V5W600_MARSA|nr:NADH dehydrogenase subunit 4L [Marphysa sanguinea]AHC01839.1 NADH dehydrogenase subunit 4L [Marphysa sanguinea]
MILPLSCLLPTASLAALLSMALQRKHLLMSLLALEGMILSMTTAIMLLTTKTSPSNSMMMLVLLTFGACEASLGLACLINLTRFKGNDLLKSATTSKC